MARRVKAPDPMVSLGETIRLLRLKRGISQEELGHRARLHRNYIGGIERAERNITILSLIKIADGLETRASKLMTDAGL